MADDPRSHAGPRASTGDENARHRELYDNAPCGLLTTAASGLIVRVNLTLCTWLGYSPEELKDKRRLIDLLTMGCKIFHQTHWLPLLQLQGSVAEVQLELVHRDGHMLPVLVNAVQRQTDSGVQHDLAVFVATDRRKYERELLAARKRAEELLERERAAQDALTAAQERLRTAAEQRAVLAEQLVGIVSHDLRTPMSAIVLGSNLLAAGNIAPAQALTITNRIVSAAGRANRLIADLLDFTQARIGGGLRINLVAIDLHALARDGVEELKLAHPGRMLEHRAVGEGTAFADPDRLAQVLTNLTSNALTYGDPERAVTITSTISARELTLQVHNLGAAIPEDLLPHIFEPLRRGEQQVKLGSRSVGLGLYIVEQIAAAHRGSVTVHSTKAEGTTFTVIIPAGSAEAG